MNFSQCIHRTQLIHCRLLSVLSRPLSRGRVAFCALSAKDLNKNVRTTGSKQIAAAAAARDP